MKRQRLMHTLGGTAPLDVMLSTIVSYFQTIAAQNAASAAIHDQILTRMALLVAALLLVDDVLQLRCCLVARFVANARIATQHLRLFCSMRNAHVTSATRITVAAGAACDASITPALDGRSHITAEIAAAYRSCD